MRTNSKGRKGKKKKRKGNDIPFNHCMSGDELVSELRERGKGKKREGKAEKRDP